MTEPHNKEFNLGKQSFTMATNAFGDMASKEFRQVMNGLQNQKQPWLVWLSGLSAACESKGRWFDSQSGHMPGLWARSPVGQPHTDVSLPLSLPSLPLCLKINK